MRQIRPSMAVTSAVVPSCRNTASSKAGTVEGNCSRLAAKSADRSTARIASSVARLNDDRVGNLDFRSRRCGHPPAATITAEQEDNDEPSHCTAAPRSRALEAGGAGRMGLQPANGVTERLAQRPRRPSKLGSRLRGVVPGVATNDLEHVARERRRFSANRADQFERRRPGCARRNIGGVNRGARTPAMDAASSSS